MKMLNGDAVAIRRRWSVGGARGEGEGYAFAVVRILPLSEDEITKPGSRENAATHANEMKGLVNNTGDCFYFCDLFCLR